jgi:ligand-binding sensor protein
MGEQKQLIEALQNSSLFQDYQRAFSEATGLPVVLRAVECWQLPFHGHRKENEFCALVAQRSRTSGCCLQVQQGLADRRWGCGEVVCPFGLTDTAVPVRVGERVVGYLQTGQVFRRRPTERQFGRILKLARHWGLETEEDGATAGVLCGQGIGGTAARSHCEAVEHFAEHLSLISNQIVVQQRSVEPPVITKAKDSYCVASDPSR